MSFLVTQHDVHTNMQTLRTLVPCVVLDLYSFESIEWKDRFTEIVCLCCLEYKTESGTKMYSFTLFERGLINKDCTLVLISRDASEAP